MKKVILILERQSGEYLLNKFLSLEGWEIMCVLTSLNLDHKKKWWKGRLIKNICEENDIPVFSSDNDSILGYLKETFPKPDLSISVLNNIFVSKEFLTWANFNSINIHGAPLPKYQGNNCTHFAILNEEKEFGVTAYRTSSEVDCGDILQKEIFEIKNGLTNYDLYQLTLKATEVLINKIIQKNFIFKKYEKFERKKSIFYKEMGVREITNETSWKDIDKISRAFYFPPFEPAYFIKDNQKVYVLPKFEVKS